jgi:hypothetical protein
MERPRSAHPATREWNDGFSSDGSEEDGQEPEQRENPAEQGMRLLRACRSGDEVGAHALLLEGAPMSSEDGNGWTPLLWASCNGHQKVRPFYLPESVHSCYLFCLLR